MSMRVSTCSCPNKSRCHSLPLFFFSPLLFPSFFVSPLPPRLPKPSSLLSSLRRRYSDVLAGKFESRNRTETACVLVRARCLDAGGRFSRALRKVCLCISRGCCACLEFHRYYWSRWVDRSWYKFLSLLVLVLLWVSRTTWLFLYFRSLPLIYLFYMLVAHGWTARIFILVFR